MRSGDCVPEIYKHLLEGDEPRKLGESALRGCTRSDEYQVHRLVEPPETRNTGGSDQYADP